MKSILDRLPLSPQEKSNAIKKAFIAFILLFIPIGQFYSFLVALPLMFIPEFNSTSKFIEYTFLYALPKHPVTIIVFGAYYFLFFFVYGMIKNIYKNRGK